MLYSSTACIVAKIIKMEKLKNRELIKIPYIISNFLKFINL